MRVPAITGVIDRRILVNYHVEPEAMQRLLPPPFRPKVVRGHAIAGICLIRLKHIRPKLLPVPWGIGSENAAHRIAVEWDEMGQRRDGVFIPRRDTDSKFNAWAGGRLFPGEHHHAAFEVNETADHLSVTIESDDGEVHVSVNGRVGTDVPATSIFQSVREASAFFESGSLGYSVTRDAGRFDGLELRCRNWQVTPLEIESVSSSFFDDRSLFPEGAAAFDCALLMRGVDHEWHSRDPLCCAPAASVAATA